MLWLLFIAITTYGTYVHTGVVEEKSSRVVEVLLAAAALLTLSLVPQVRRPHRLLPSPVTVMSTARHGAASRRCPTAPASTTRPEVTTTVVFRNVRKPVADGGGLPYARTRVFRRRH